MAFDADIGSESTSPHHHLPLPERYKRIIFLFVYFIACMLNLNKELWKKKIVSYDGSIQKKPYDVPLKKRFIKKETEAQIMATHSSILAGTIPWTEKPGELLSMRSQRVGLKESDWAHMLKAQMIDLTWSGLDQADLLKQVGGLLVYPTNPTCWFTEVLAALFFQ